MLGKLYTTKLFVTRLCQWFECYAFYLIGMDLMRRCGDTVHEIPELPVHIIRADHVLKSIIK